jgi:hypothetical protein
MRTLPTLAALALALGVAALFATVPPAQAQSSEYNIDTNDDGVVDTDEWSAFGDTFSDFDSNGDGMLDESEWESAANGAWGGAPGGGDDGPLFGLLDTTDDNQVGQDEYFSEESFDELDDNENGVLDDDEFGA